MNDVLTLSGVRQAALIHDGSLSPEELVRAHIQRIEEVNPGLNAVIDLMADRALADARRARRREMRPLEGVPFSIKDSIEVQGTVCSAGTLGYRANPPSARDATVVSRLRHAGAIPLARTNLPDLLFAFESDNLIFGRTSNPHDSTRTAGGSSGGEAALIAACGSPFGLGSDAAGSVRLPAHYCGIASLKPTSGRLPRSGHVPGAGGWIEALWQIGPMARRVEDLRLMMRIMAGPDGLDRTASLLPISEAIPLRGLRIALFTDNGILAANAATKDAVHAAGRALEGAGCIVEEYRPAAVERSYDLEMKLLGPDGGDSLRSFAQSIGSHRTHPLLEGWLRKLERWRTDLAGFASYWAEWDSFRDAMFAELSRFHLFLSPVAAQPAVPHGSTIDEDVFPGFSYTMTHNLTGWPAAVVRAGSSEEGLPIGVQIAGGPWQEETVLAAASCVQSVS